MSVIQIYLTENKENLVVCFRKGRLFEEIIKNSTYMYFSRFGSCRWFLGYMTLTKEQPADVVSLKVENNKERVLGTGNEFKVTTFNIDMVD